MKLAEAIDIARRPGAGPLSPKSLHLACGITPLHLATFLKAHVRLRLPQHALELQTGLFGDLQGNLQRAAQAKSTETVVLIEWSDLDRRLGLRDAAGWTSAILDDIQSETERSLDRLAPPVELLLESSLVVLSPPTLPLPPAGSTSSAQDGVFELRLHALLAAFLSRIAALPGIRIVSRQSLDEVSPAGARLDARSALDSGFPYTMAHADILAETLAELLYPKPPLKGLITDLDGTLWKGILGEVGVDGVTWDLASHAQHHALYQQFLASLAERGVLVGVASKNEAALVLQALQRQGILLPQSAIFPIEAHWQPKSASVERILAAWNIAADSVAFLDDSPIELAEVQTRFPQITALPFPTKDPNGVWQLLKQLRTLFGRPVLLDEDRLRSSSLKSSAILHAAAPAESPEEFLGGLAAAVTLDYSRTPRDDRPFELVNKTNQFNLNGKRLTQGEWRARLDRTDSFLLLVSYQDKFGPLGRIAVVAGTIEGPGLQVSTWVMSCRAFSRRIEHRTLERLFHHFGVEAIAFDYQPTDRNQPLREFFEAFLGAPLGTEPLRISRTLFDERCPQLHHRVIEANDGSDDHTSPGVLFQSIP